MNRKLLSILAIAGLALSLPAAAGAASLPAPGFYTAAVFVVEASGPENSCQFVAQTGQSYNGVFYYPGPRKLGANLRVVSATDDGPNVYVHEYSRTGNPGIIHWSGFGLEGFEGNTPLMPTSFKATIRYLDESSFTMTMTVDVTVAEDKVCSYGANIALARSAPVN